jgi:glutamyl-tRNA synthetase
MTVRTRFAPSPTGMLHIGGARTALFNWLFARHHGGEFVLRIEDTDRERSTDAATQVILDGLEWLRLQPDAAPVFQSTRQARHAEVARQMLAAGTAYAAYDTQEELRQMREAGAARYDGRWRDRDPAEAPPGVAPAIRLKAPRDGETVVDDLVQGEVRVANAELDDMIILRGDGTATYQHAVVVDDHDMAISHVIRGDDHLTNTFRQRQVYDAMGWVPPRFAHIPLIHGADGAKLSKRHGAVSILEFREQGFLPDALCNYLLRLGWGHGDAEILSRDEAVRLFDLDGVGRGAARMDYAKLLHVNGVYLRATDNVPLVRDTLSLLAGRPGIVLGEDSERRLLALMPHLKERAKTLLELADNAAFLVRVPPLPMEPKAASVLNESAVALLVALGESMAEVGFSVGAVDAALRKFADSHGLKLGQVAQPLRVALTGSTTSPPIDATLVALGREETLARIRAAAGK